MMDLFAKYLKEDDKSENTIKGYVQSVTGFLTWFDQSKGTEFKRLHRENVREYISFLKTVKNAKAKTINTKVNALVKFNEFLVESKVQEEMVLTKKDYVKVQQQYASLAKLEEKDVEKFRQLVLEGKEDNRRADKGTEKGVNKRNYAIVTLLAYAGLRISEALNLKMKDINFVSREVIVQDGKGSKTRSVLMSGKVKTALQSWIKEREKQGIDSEYLFVSNRNGRMDRTTVNKLFNEFSEKLEIEVTPHDLRHFFCSHMIKKGFSIDQVANQAGHSNVHTTLLYTNPSRQEMLEKMDQL